MEKYTKLNARTVDAWVAKGWEWGVPVSPAACAAARKGKWDIVLTPTVPVPHAWLGSLRGKRVLGLAAGGAQQMPILSLLGAECTVMDNSRAQLASEEAVAEREGYRIRTALADMTERFPFPDQSFDLIIHPVANCFVRDIGPVWKECARVLKKSGCLLAGFDAELNYALAADERTFRYRLPFDPLANPEQRRDSLQNDWGLAFSHTLAEEIGGQLRAGLVLDDIYEDCGSAGLAKEYRLPAYYATRAHRPS